MDIVSNKLFEMSNAKVIIFFSFVENSVSTKHRLLELVFTPFSSSMGKEKYSYFVLGE